MVEDMLHLLTNVLPFGIRLHRRACAGGRHHRFDGKPGFLVKVGITSYKMTNIVKNDKGQIVSFHAVGLDGTLTRAWVWH